MNLKDEIRKLVNVQNYDKKIYTLNEQKNNEIPQKIKELKDLINKKENEFSAYKDKVNHLELDKKNKEGELSAKEENLKKAKAQLYQLKSNKEYQVKLNEIRSIEADISCDEEEIIKSLDDIEQKKNKVKQEKSKLEAETEKIKQEIKEFEQQAKEIEQNLSSLKNKRQHLAGAINEKIRSQYEDLLNKRNGLAIVPVKSGNCGACFMLINHQKINEIKMYDRLILCENCVRILYIPEDLEL